MGSNCSIILLPQAKVGVGMDFGLHFEIKNDNDAPLKKGMRITLKDSSYYRQADLLLPKDIQPFSSSGQLTFANIRMKGQHPLASEIPSYLEFILTPSVRSYSFSVPNNINQFTGDFLQEPPNPNIPFNFLIYGRNGVGKSSFINSCYTLLRDRLCHIVPIGAGTDHITTCLNKYPLIDKKVNLWDTWGVNEENYQKNELSDFLSGMLPDGWEMSETKLNETERKTIEQIQETAPSRRIHAIIIIVGASTIFDDSQEIFNEKIKNDILKVQRLGYTPLLVLNRADELIGKFSVRMLDDIRHPKMEELRQKACEFFALPITQVFCQINYRMQERPQFNLDRMTLSVLSKAIHVAKDFMERHPAA
eukprot:TRINITY_DN1887_c0_g2_i1.p1 TRINITY_DN1887_c0_g2~~TRINITY_DN1887_c0_g2_i1.p1  ORF type:complete len:363 (-),score=46.49 TRINITY_DN1887_c0_g2_i1:226-1314(-)